MEEKEILQEEELQQEIMPAKEEEYRVKYISGMYKNWFLDYASYVILERAVPHLYDGLKPVQRRIMHAMKRLDDGRYNKVANIIGYTMQYHPHGDASIGGALVQLGQKELLIDMQGNWGNIYTGDNAAAPRYIEARLSKFALAVVFNPKTTNWKQSYDGRNKEPINLPVKFPLLLAQGVEGIAVGLASKIMPHNFIELIDACVNHLRNEDFELYPDFLTGGFIDVSRYNDGLRGGKVRVRAKIDKIDKKTIVIKELPFGKTTGSLIESILSANEKNKIKIKKVEDNTSDKVEILIHLPSGVSPDKTIDALYAVTDCEVSISPNSTVIVGDKPKFLGIKEMLRFSADNTLKLLKLELEIRKAELEEAWHLSSLEKIFIEEEIYLLIRKCETWEAVIETIDTGLDPFKAQLKRAINRDDIVRLTEIKIKRISKYDAFKATDYLKSIEEEIKKIKYHLAHIVDFTVDYYTDIKKRFSKGRERRTEIRNFEEIIASKVVVRNEKLYVNYEEGFAGMSLKKDEFVANCSDIDDIIVFRKDGTYFITPVTGKFYIGKKVIHIDVFKKNDTRTIYNAVYRDGATGYAYMKRFFVKSITRDKEYNLTKGSEKSEILHFSANANGEAEVLKVVLKPRPRLKKRSWEEDLKELAIKGRASQGNILSKYRIHRITVKEEGISTLGGRKIWFDSTVLKINDAQRGEFVGEFSGDDKILVVTKDGDAVLTSYELTNHYKQGMFLFKKYDEKEILTAVFYSAEQEYYYLKRFTVENSDKIMSITDEHPDSKLISISTHKKARFKIIFGGENSNRANETVDAWEFISVKSYKARGKRLTTYQVEEIIELEPVEVTAEEVAEPVNEELFEEQNNEPEFEVVRNTDDGQVILDL